MKHFMKIVLILVCICLLTALSACGSESGGSEDGSYTFAIDDGPTVTISVNSDDYSMTDETDEGYFAISYVSTSGSTDLGAALLNVYGTFYTLDDQQVENLKDYDGYTEASIGDHTGYIVETEDGEHDLLIHLVDEHYLCLYSYDGYEDLVDVAYDLDIEIEEAAE